MVLILLAEWCSSLDFLLDAFAEVTGLFLACSRSSL